MSTGILERATFRTSRLLDFASEKELIAQTGHQAEEWPYVIIKELMDNALDACEEAGVAPEITIRVDDKGIEVDDNGPGMPAKVVKDITDFQVRVSSRDAYVSPTRGAQGNALKTLLAMPFILDGEGNLGLEIEACGVRHNIVMGVDRVRQALDIKHDTATGKNAGTRVRVNLNSPRSNELCRDPRILPFASRYHWVNPHLSLTLEFFGKRYVLSRSDGAWTKWRPSDPTSPHWYKPEHLERLIGAYITHDDPKVRTVGELISTFRGLSGTGKRKAILGATGLFRAPLRQLVKGNDLDHAAVAGLLEAMQAESKPVKPDSLGIIGKEHFARIAQAHECDWETFGYRCIKGTTGGVPYVIEAAFGWSEGYDGRILVTGINFSPAIKNPFRDLNGTSLDAILQQQFAGRDEPIFLALHMACARVEYTDRGKSAAVIPLAPAEEIRKLVEAVTGKWAKQRRHEQREASARANRAHAMRERKRVDIKAAAWEFMEEAYMKASAGGTLPAHARQIMYAARAYIQERSGKLVTGKYFTQTLLPDYIEEHRVGWNVAYDARGHFTEPHTGKRFGLGTLEVRHHLREVDSHTVASNPHYEFRDDHYPTLGPRNRYGAILFIEKEGFMPLFQAVRLAERYDLAIASTKGMSVTAMRELIDSLCTQNRGIPLLALHDFDRTGFSIFGTLHSDTRRYRFANDINVADLGLRLGDIDGLESETVAVPEGWSSVRKTLLKHGATEAECDFLKTRRVELNALPSDQLVAFIERKLAEHGVTKVTPDAGTLADAYRRMRRQAQVQQRIDELIQEMDSVPADAIAVPADLKRKIRAAQKADPALPWDVALRQIVAKGTAA